MRCMTLTLLLAGTAGAQQPSVELSGVAISRGMPVDEVRAVMPSESILDRFDTGDGREVWLIFPPESWEDGGSITFRNGQVIQAKGWVKDSDALNTYEMFALLNELLVQLTDGQDTCVMIRTLVPTDAFPQSETQLILPNRTIAFGTAFRGDPGHVAISESIHDNPVPERETVRRNQGQTGHCVFR